jgi:hypothetical protein
MIDLLKNCIARKVSCEKELSTSVVREISNDLFEKKVILFVNRKI